MLSEARKCKKVMGWSGDFGIDQYVSWCLPQEDLHLDVLWNKSEEFCKPQTNEVRARFDLLTSFRQGDMSVDEWYNAVQAQINLEKYPTETAKISHRDIFFLRDEEFVPKTINDSNNDLEQIPASKVRQLAKRLESSKSTARHIKKMSSEPHATQVNLLRHQRTEIPPNKAKRKHFKNNKFRSKNMGYSNEDHHQQAPYKKNKFESKKKFNPRLTLQNKDRCHKCSDSKHIEGFQCFARKYQCRNCHKFDHFSSLCYKKQEAHKKRPRSPKAYQLTSRLSAQDNSIYSHSSDNLSSDESFCLQMKVQAVQANTNVTAPKHLFTDLEFKVRPHKNKSNFLQARIDTCAYVNIMPVSICKYLFKDPNCAKTAPIDLQLGTYTNKKIKIFRILQLIYYTSRHKMYHRSNILCGQQ